MGIPTFFRSILQNNKSVIFGATDQYPIDYFFIDYNSLIYNTWNKIHKNLKNNDINHIYTELIKETLNTTIFMINNIVKPKKYAYISMDGVAPRAKTVQQRSRRYKSVQLKEILQKKRNDLNYNTIIDWDPSPNICPGTVFMQKLSHEIKNAMKNNEFQSKIFLSDSNVPGEGEHKFLKHLRKINQDNETKNDHIVVYSPDGDMISLSLLTHKNNIYIMRIPDEKSPNEARFCNDFEFIYCDLNKVKHDFFKQLTKTFNDDDIDELRVLNDYNFLLFLVGNDFVPSLPFLKIRSGGLNTLITIYNQIRPEMNAYLIDYHPIHQKEPKINMNFFTEIISSLAKIEHREMNKEFAQCQKELIGEPNSRRSFLEKEMDAFQIFESRFQHVPFFNPDHPEHKKYVHLIDKINYSLPKHEWKGQYYNYFFNLDSDDSHTYNTERTNIVINFFESLIFTLRYYLTGCPCYDWHYRYRVSPIPSDMLTVIRKYNFDLNTIKFLQKKPYQPFEQLLMILPPQMNFLLPKCLQKIMLEGETSKFYPTTFEIDALAGVKYIYSEAILPDLDIGMIQTEIQKMQHLFSESEKKRNINSSKIIHTKK